MTTIPLWSPSPLVISTCCSHVPLTSPIMADSFGRENHKSAWGDNSKNRHRFTHNHIQISIEKLQEINVLLSVISRVKYLGDCSSQTINVVVYLGFLSVAKPVYLLSVVFEALISQQNPHGHTLDSTPRSWTALYFT